MKGKGKAIIPSDKDCPLQFPDLQPVDHLKQCPCYTAILSRGESDTVLPDELNSLQSDLETLFSASGKRLRLLESEINTLVNWAEKKEAPTKKTIEASAGSPQKRSKHNSSEDKPCKKFKEGAGKASAGPGRPPKGKNTQIKVQPPDTDFKESASVDLPKLPKNDAVNRFWASVEPYCAELTPDDMKFLEEIIKSHEDDSDYFKIPALGRHYADKWAQEDIFEEQKEGAKVPEKRRTLNNNNTVSNSNEVNNLFRKAELSNSIDDYYSSPFGPLTQRLVSALIEENLMAPLDDTMNDLNPETVEDLSSMSPRALAKQLNIGNPVQLEKRIKRELEEQGLIDAEEKVEENPDDEILTELRRKQQELKALTQHNILATKRLMKLAKDEMARQDLRKKLIAVEAEVMEAYRRIQGARSKKKLPTKKERDAVWKALKERDSIVKVLES